VQEEGGYRGTPGGHLSVRLLEVTMCGFSVCMHNPGPAWEEYAEYASTGYGSQVSVQAQYFAEILVHTHDHAQLDTHDSAAHWAALVGC